MKKLTQTIFAAAAMTLALGASAATVVQPTIISNVATNVEDNDGDLHFAKFNQSLGTLTSVKFELFSLLSGSIDVTNNAVTGVATDFTVTAGGQIDGDLLGGTVSAIGSVSKTFNLGPGQSGHVTLSPWTESGSVVLLSSNADLSAFIGGDEFHALLTGWSTQVTSGSGNATYKPRINLDGYAHVTYTYETAPVPEPETYAMLLAGLGLMGVVARRRKSA
ncbi:hypothetical protein containing PEP-CTERM anchor [Janthinobacterium sp. HH01]|uniref:choice-of-anchor E domain-containing protein n=1 Tax=Janthinobacterium sp. HH01 TaxID=1198452 RepID=UPI0002AEC163|nr:choice-of-anchor E domain-containing protein [Janthinobacterium sp. HH01]ELX09859.1 hypothetical protein containing PEP-CTERM anchor [Janthinobacterium sp. HH01]